MASAVVDSVSHLGEKELDVGLGGGRKKAELGRRSIFQKSPSENS